MAFLLSFEGTCRGGREAFFAFKAPESGESLAIGLSIVSSDLANGPRGVFGISLGVTEGTF